MHDFSSSAAAAAAAAAVTSFLTSRSKIDAKIMG